MGLHQQSAHHAERTETRIPNLENGLGVQPSSIVGGSRLRTRQQVQQLCVLWIMLPPVIGKATPNTTVVESRQVAQHMLATRSYWNGILRLQSIANWPE